MIVNTKGLKIYMSTAGGAEVGIIPTAISKAAPALVTGDNSLVEGQPVYVDQVGFTELDGKHFVAKNVTATQFELAGSDTTTSTGVLSASPLITAIQLDDYVSICASSIAVDNNAPGTVSVATFCDPTASVPSVVVEAGNLTLTLYHDPTQSGFSELMAAEADGLERTFVVVFPANGGYLICTGVVSYVGLSDIPLDGAAVWTVTVALSTKPEFIYDQQ